MKWYLDNLYSIILRPTLFYQDMPKGSWQEGSLSFALVTGWVLSFFLTLVVFINSYFPTGLTLIEGIYGKKLLIAVPVLAVMAIVFFLMTLFIVGGILIATILGLFMLCAAMLNFLLILLGGTGNIFEVIKAVLYSSAIMIAGAINILLLILVKYKMMSVPFWIMSEKGIYYVVSIYLFFVFSIIGYRTHKVAGWKSVLAATVPFVILMLINIVLSSKILPKVASILG